MTIKEKILKIMSLALEINPPEIKNIGKKRTAVFVNWSPHCNCLDVTTYENGWDIDKEESERMHLYASWDDANEKLDAIIARLEEIREEIDEFERLADV